MTHISNCRSDPFRSLVSVHYVDAADNSPIVTAWNGETHLPYMIRSVSITNKHVSANENKSGKTMSKTNESKRP